MSAATQPVGRRVSLKTAGDFLKGNPIYVAIALLVVVTSVVEPKFLTLNNFDNIVRQFGVLIFAALGMTFVIMAGFLDLSIGGIISLVAVVTVSSRVTSTLPPLLMALAEIVSGGSLALGCEVPEVRLLSTSRSVEKLCATGS